jgi:hypothetical protein
VPLYATIRGSRGTGVLTVRDVAREAGVSVANVSRALGSAGRVGPDVLQRFVVSSEKSGRWPEGSREIAVRQGGLDLGAGLTVYEAVVGTV